MRSLLTLIGVTAALLMAPAVASAATITVNTTDDVNGAQCTLRDAITAANGDAATGGCVKGSGPDTIGFSVPAASTITLGTSLPAIQNSVDVQGPGASQLTVDGAGSVRIFDIANGSVGISGVTIAHGRCIEGCGIRNFGTLTVDHAVVDHNIAVASGGTSAYADGAGIYNGGTLTVHFSTISNNAVEASGASGQNMAAGAGIYNTKFGSLSIDHSTFNGNSATAVAGGGTDANALGGAILNGGILNVSQSTITANSLDASGAALGNTAQGAGIGNANSANVHVTLDRTTIAGNSVSASGPSMNAQAGGMSLFGGSISVTSSTIVSNSATMYSNLMGTAATLQNTIVADPHGGGANCSGHPTSLGYNVDSGTSCGFNQATDMPSTNPQLDPAGLADNGGPTQTIALLAGSPVIDQGLSSAGESADQRGSSRPNDFGPIANANGGDGTDIGAFERQDTTPPDTAIDSGPADGSASNAPAPTFAFSATEAGSTFECSVDGAGYAPCSSPNTLAPLSDGQHTFAVRATDAAHNVDPTPATRTFTVDGVAPDTSIDAGPASGSVIRTSTPTFAYSATEAGSSFECAIDSGGFTPCSSPQTTAPLGDGQHTFAVRAVDAQSNQDATPASRTFSIDTTAPETTLVKPIKVTHHRSLRLNFASSEPGSTFICKIDGKPFQVCSSPLRIGKLSYRRHTLTVLATDSVGNADPTPATDRFRVTPLP